MNARALNALAGVICRAQENGKRTPMGIAIAVESAGLLMDPETAAEMKRLRLESQGWRLRVDEVERKYVFDTAELKKRVAELEAAAPAELDKALEDLTGARLSLWEEEQENARLFLAWKSAQARARRKAVAMKRLRARVAELERLVQAMCDALNGHDCPDPSEGPMQTVTRVAVRLMEAERRVAELETAPAELTVYRASHDSITFGLYTTVEAAWTHCKTYAEREFPAPFAAFWSEGDDGVTELMVSVHGSPDVATGYVVTPLTVASAYDPDGDE